MAIEYYQLSVQAVLASSYRENTLVFQGSGLTADNTLINGESLLLAWQASIQALWLACLPPDYGLMRLVARRISAKPSFVPMAQFQAGAAPGTRGSEAATQNLCPVVFMIPPMGTKSGGKIFMPAVDIADVLNNTYASGYTTAINALMTAMLTPFSSGGISWALAVWSKKLATGHLIMSWDKSPRFGFQGKRRMPAGAQ